MILRPIVIAICAVLLANCSDEEALRTCRYQVKQTVLMRQLALPEQQRAEAETCLANSNRGPDFCRDFYPDAETIVRDCMSDKGYSFAVINSPTDYVDAKCYKATWLVKFESLLRTPTNSATPPVSGKCQF
jgi:hypothetical protein